MKNSKRKRKEIICTPHSAERLVGTLLHTYNTLEDIDE